ncbi:MAG: GNAT family N-acetyltransferase [Alphaproteobacteria bacterium]
MAVRLARRDEAVLIPAIEDDAGRRFLGTHIEPMLDTESGGGHDLEPMIEAGNLWVATDAADTAIGFAATSEEGGYLYIHELDVALDHQGRGHGRALLDAVVAEARRRGLAGVSLTTDRTIAWNRPFYERYGFMLLDDDEVPAALRAHLDDEISRGHDRSWRCAMVLRV